MGKLTFGATKDKHFPLIQYDADNELSIGI